MRIPEAVRKIETKMKKLKEISLDYFDAGKLRKSAAVDKCINELDFLRETLLLDYDSDTIEFVSLSTLVTAEGYSVDEEGFFYKLAYSCEEGNFLLYMVPISTL